jgi:hypothetical protein
MRREAPPDGFAERVIARADHEAKRWTWLPRMPLLRWAAVAAIPAALLLVVQVNTEQRRRAEGELAKAKVMAAMRITAESFESAREKVVRATGHGETNRRPQNPI